jgi:hypothetical protein
MEPATTGLRRDEVAERPRVLLASALVDELGAFTTLQVVTQHVDGGASSRRRMAPRKALMISSPRSWLLTSWTMSSSASNFTTADATVSGLNWPRSTFPSSIRSAMY